MGNSIVRRGRRNMAFFMEVFSIIRWKNIIGSQTPIAKLNIRFIISNMWVRVACNSTLSGSEFIFSKIRK